MFKRVKKNKKGFTLAELLIVVAIIAVLVAISIPIFNAQLEKSREAVDAANIRAAYAEAMSDYLANDSQTATATVDEVKQHTDTWTITPDWPDNLGVVPGIKTGDTVTITVVPPTGSATEPTITCTKN